ncbi:hypothetical protein EDD21DRAFT_362455 [Dissophora ornata]|nr:hypothetical protein EDD21DRAFT_362455 [Dissophora ornata]
MLVDTKNLQTALSLLQSITSACFSIVFAIIAARTATYAFKTYGDAGFSQKISILLKGQGIPTGGKVALAVLTLLVVASSLSDNVVFRLTNLVVVPGGEVVLDSAVPQQWPMISASKNSRQETVADFEKQIAGLVCSSDDKCSHSNASNLTLTAISAGSSWRFDFNGNGYSLENKPVEVLFDTLQTSSQTNSSGAVNWGWTVVLPNQNILSDSPLAVNAGVYTKGLTINTYNGENGYMAGFPSKLGAASYSGAGLTAASFGSSTFQGIYYVGFNDSADVIVELATTVSRVARQQPSGTSASQGFFAEAMLAFAEGASELTGNISIAEQTGMYIIYDAYKLTDRGLENLSCAVAKSSRGPKYQYVDTTCSKSLISVHSTLFKLNVPYATPGVTTSDAVDVVAVSSNNAAINASVSVVPLGYLYYQSTANVTNNMTIETPASLVVADGTLPFVMSYTPTSVMTEITTASLVVQLLIIALAAGIAAAGKLVAASHYRSSLSRVIVSATGSSSIKLDSVDPTAIEVLYEKRSDKLFIAVSGHRLVQAEKLPSNDDGDELSLLP